MFILFNALKGQSLILGLPLLFCFLYYTDRTGVKRKGAYWTMEQVKEATKDYKFPAGVNEWDVFVAANAIRADLCKKFDDKQVLDAMYSFFFADEDWPGNNKVWHYMACKNNK